MLLAFATIPRLLALKVCPCTITFQANQCALPRVGKCDDLLSNDLDDLGAFNKVINKLD